jgi:hypothetical protein
MENFKFTFKTENDYMEARSRGYIDNYDMVRMNYKSKESSIDYPIHSEEEYNKAIDILNNHGIDYNAYQAIHYYDITEYE